ncbi:uncharacterized protein LOC132313224 [Cornus florida]|uniref:uncharacterized protein LOC132313224 n=1 Tax=Cornus florida TaxID=4283 RepID=UPI0028A27904|nr:uncharacterized protein LOC132313224 [Cornus florida]XP_059667893.1 uncharacterized protein LOC132313224 [Cornus florida]
MEMSNFYILSLKPPPSRSMFSCNELNGLRCPIINHFGVFHNLSSASLKSYNLVLACSCRRANEVQVLFGHHPCNLGTGKHATLGRASRLYSLKPCQVKSEDSEGTLSGESILLNEQTLERELQIAIEEENYTQAAKIRDNLRVLQEDSKTSVLAANARFYNSFRNGDLAAMQALWAKGENVCVVHPGVSGISGYDLVMGSWEFVWADYEFPLQIEIKDVQVHVKGDLGYVTCTELVKTKGSSWGRQFATNVFERIDGQWFICIHHASHVEL